MEKYIGVIDADLSIQNVASIIYDTQTANDKDSHHVLYLSSQAGSFEAYCLLSDYIVNYDGKIEFIVCNDLHGVIVDFIIKTPADVDYLPSFTAASLSPMLARTNPAELIAKDDNLSKYTVSWLRAYNKKRSELYARLGCPQSKIDKFDNGQTIYFTAKELKQMRKRYHEDK